MVFRYDMRLRLGVKVGQKGWWDGVDKEEEESWLKEVCHWEDE